MLIGSLGVFSISGCSTTTVVADLTANLLKQAAPGLEQYWDYETVGKAFPANIIQLEGILRMVPDNKEVIHATISAYIGYGYGWISYQAERANGIDDYEKAEKLEQRLRIMYQRAWALAQHSLRLSSGGFDEAWAGGVDTFTDWLSKNFTTKKDAQTLLWAGQALGSWIQSNVEDMDVVADLPMAKAILQCSVEFDPNYLFQTGKMALAVLACSEFPPNMAESKKMFEEVLVATERRNLIVQVNMARFYATNLGDHELFANLLNEVLNASDMLPEARLSNLIARRRAEYYLSRTKYFFADMQP